MYYILFFFIKIVIVFFIFSFGFCFAMNILPEQVSYRYLPPNLIGSSFREWGFKLAQMKGLLPFRALKEATIGEILDI